jgi:hypothetical protein
MPADWSAARCSKAMHLARVGDYFARNEDVHLMTTRLFA